MVQKELKAGNPDPAMSFFANGHIGSIPIPVKKGLIKKSKIDKKNNEHKHMEQRQSQRRKWLHHGDVEGLPL